MSIRLILLIQMASQNTETNRKRKYTYLCPISWAIVKAEPRPISSLILQLLSGSHIPATDAKPGHTHKHTHR